MAQLTIYLPEKEARAIRTAANRSKRSVSEWARKQLSRGLVETWPDNYFDVLGALRDPTFKRPAQFRLQNDARRKEL